MARIYVVLMMAMFVAAWAAPRSPAFWLIVLAEAVTFVAWVAAMWWHRNDGAPEE